MVHMQQLASGHNEATACETNIRGCLQEQHHINHVLQLISKSAIIFLSPLTEKLV